MDLSTFETNEEKTQEGVWCDLGDGRVKVARWGNKKFQRYLQRLTAPYKQMMQKGQMPEEENEKILVKGMAKHILLDWENITVDGNNEPYSFDVGVRVFSESRFKDFREVIVSMSQEADLFRNDEVEDAVEKSEATSVGNLSGVNTKTS